MEELMAWVDESRGRHFIVKMGNSYNETRWRVCVWVKPEGEIIEGIPGEGFGPTAAEAAKGALMAWKDQATLARKTGVSWYVPGNLADLIEEETNE